MEGECNEHGLHLDVGSTLPLFPQTRISHFPFSEPILVHQLAIELTTMLLLPWAARTTCFHHHLASADFSISWTS